MVDEATREAIFRLARARCADFEKSLASERGTIQAELSDKGFLISTLQVVRIKGAGESSLVQRAGTIVETIKEVCNSRKVVKTPDLGNQLQRIFDELYGEQRDAVQRFVESVVMKEATKLCPLGELQPNIVPYREIVALFADTLETADHWTDAVTWFRARWWSVPLVGAFVIVPIVVQWITWGLDLFAWIKAE